MGRKVGRESQRQRQRQRDIQKRGCAHANLEP